MNRQQRRASERKSKKDKTKTYNFTESQLQEYVKKAIEVELKNNHNEMMSDAIDTALILLLALPLEVLMDYYWPKSYEKKIPEFTNYVFEYYKRWQNGEINTDKLKEDLLNYGKIKIIEEGV